MIAAGWVATTLAIVCVLTVVSLALFFMSGGPFGPLNDAGNALIGVLSATLAIMLVHHVGGWPGAVAAAVGAGIVVVGSWLVM
jgi:hypothetical protein